MKKMMACGLALLVGLTWGSVANAATANDVVAESASNRAIEVKNADTVAPVTDYVESEDVFQVAGLKSGQLTGEYRLAKYDTIALSILGFPNGLGYTTGSSSNEGGEADTIQIGPDGMAALPYVGNIKLAGLTTDEATEVIKEKLSRYIKIPAMYVSVKNYAPRKVYVMGEVSSPGMQKLDIDSLSAYAAITSAGGFSKRGRSTQVQVIRVIDGTMYYRQLNMKAFIRKHDLSQNVALQDGDIVYVPKSNGIKWQEDILPFFQAYTYYKAIVD